MGFQQSAKYLSRLGVKPAVDVSTIELPELRTRQDVEELGLRGIAEMEQYGSSRAYLQWQRALQLGLDEALPDLAIAGGAITRSLEEMAADAGEAAVTSAQYFRRDQVHPLIERMGWADMEVNQLREQLHLALGAAPDHRRGPILDAISAIEASPYSSMGVTISWELPEPELVVEVNSGSEGHSDPYTIWREGASDHGLAGLAIKPSVSPDPLFSGITTMNPDGGGQYEVASDWAIAAAASSGGNFDED